MFRVLFICTHNRCRSILCEAIFNSIAEGLIEARSAGSSPADEVHPLTLQHLARRGYATDGLRSQSWDEFENWQPTVVITVCDQAAAEPCPLYLISHPCIHWGLADPSRLSSTEAASHLAFARCIEQIEQRARAVRGCLLAEESGEARLRSICDLIARWPPQDSGEGLLEQGQ